MDGFVRAAEFAYFGPRVPNAENAKRVELALDHDRVRIEEAAKRLAQRWLGASPSLDTRRRAESPFERSGSRLSDPCERGDGDTDAPCRTV